MNTHGQATEDAPTKEQKGTLAASIWKDEGRQHYSLYMLPRGSLDSLFLYLKLTQTAEKGLNKENWFFLMTLRKWLPV